MLTQLRKKEIEQLHATRNGDLRLEELLKEKK
jgi:hypothetical protein